MTIEPAGAVTRERRLANLRATLARAGGPPIGPDQPPARAPFAGRRSPVLAARLAAALGADVAEVAGGFVVRRTVAPIELPLDRDRLARPARDTRRPTRRSCASTPRRRASPPRRARWRSSSASRAGRAMRSARPSSCCPTTPTSRRCSRRSPPGSRRTRGS